MAMAEKETLSCDVRVPFQSSSDAEVAYRSLVVDPEPRRSEVTKTFGVEGSTLTVSFTAKEAKMLRVAVGSFFDHLTLVVDTIREFGPQR